MSYIIIDLDDYEVDSQNCIDVDLDDYDDEIKEYVRDNYDIDVDSFSGVQDLIEGSNDGTLISFRYRNLADEFLMEEIIERYDLKRMMV